MVTLEVLNNLFTRKNLLLNGNTLLNVVAIMADTKSSKTRRRKEKITNQTGCSSASRDNIGVAGVANSADQ